MTLTVHVIRPPFGEDHDVVASYERLYRSIEAARELWRLLGEHARAVEIGALVENSMGGALDTDAISRMLALVEPLDEAIVGPLTDKDERLTGQAVVELRARTQTLDLDETRGEDAQWAVSEAMVGIRNLQRILRRALVDGTHLVIE